MRKQIDVECICLGLNSCSKQLTENLSRITYRQRLRIERYLFFAARLISQRFFCFELNSFSQRIFDVVGETTKERNCPKAHQLLKNIFELRLFVAKLTSTDPYVRHDAMESVCQTEKQANVYVARQIRRIARELAGGNS